MGREIKRVALDFDHPVGDWKGHAMDGACAVIFAALVIELVLR